MGNYEFWVDAYNKLHKISAMETIYINNCLKQLQIWSGEWGTEELEDLTTSDMEKANDVGQKAWYVINGQGYIDAFTKELIARESQKK